MKVIAGSVRIGDYLTVNGHRMLVESNRPNFHSELMRGPLGDTTVSGRVVTLDGMPRQSWLLVASATVEVER